eukprot:TRINITY_DN773995_c0_g1_i1.p1 TRINITY_DN773995_c0_g1~~TRINITY_DN773995_c0_g1_i1.p1  ORF type:complete len:169 (+),score=51.59 TRINITY_DN773995_c0_g1_i1:69-575(+)
MSRRTFASELLRKQLMQLNKNPTEGINVGLVEDGNLFKWNVLIVGPSKTYYEGGMFEALLEFPDDFPDNPPKMTFTTDMWHPNIYSDGRVCISILHSPGVDETNPFETAAERWRPVLGVEAILLSVISMLSDPNDESPANIDAAVMWRNDIKSFRRKVRRTVERSLDC